jgi:hypothetical protein
LKKKAVKGQCRVPRTRLRYYCSPHHTNSALYPVTEQLERAAGFQVEDSAETRLDKLEVVLAEATDNLAEVTPLIAALLPIQAGPRYPPLKLTPEEQKLRTFEALLGQITGLAERLPVLMVLEDAQWIDPTTSELFGLVIDRIQRLPVLLSRARVSRNFALAWRPGTGPVAVCSIPNGLASWQRPTFNPVSWRTRSLRWIGRPGPPPRPASATIRRSCTGSAERSSRRRATLPKRHPGSTARWRPLAASRRNRSSCAPRPMKPYPLG